MVSKRDADNLLIFAAQKLISSYGLSFAILLTLAGYCIYDFVPIIGDEIVRPLAQEAGSSLKILLFGPSSPPVVPG